jgi:hypothetical protein
VQCWLLLLLHQLVNCHVCCSRLWQHGLKQQQAAEQATGQGMLVMPLLSLLLLLLFLLLLFEPVIAALGITVM